MPSGYPHPLETPLFNIERFTAEVVRPRVSGRPIDKDGAGDGRVDDLGVGVVA